MIKWEIIGILRMLNNTLCSDGVSREREVLKEDGM
jgi:hypothetical protein